MDCIFVTHFETTANPRSGFGPAHDDVPFGCVLDCNRARTCLTLPWCTGQSSKLLSDQLLHTSKAQPHATLWPLPTWSIQQLETFSQLQQTRHLQQCPCTHFGFAWVHTEPCSLFGSILETWDYWEHSTMAMQPQSATLGLTNLELEISTPNCRFQPFLNSFWVRFGVVHHALGWEAAAA